MLKRLSWTALLLPALLLRADPVPVNDVVAAARGWLALTDATPLDESLGSGLTFMTPFTDGNGTLLYYAVYLENGGLMVMAPDDAIDPVVAFSPEAGDLTDPSPCNHLRIMLDADLADRLAEVKAGSVKDAEAKAAKWALLVAAATDPQGVKSGLGGVSDLRVSPLIYSKWNQSTVSGQACYNYYTPPYSAGNAHNYVCGCVATALAQLMYYHKYPKKGVGVRALPIWINGGGPYNRKLRGGNGYGGPYDWGNMPADVKSEKVSTSQRMAIGALCHDAGVASQMKYGSYSSSAPLCFSWNNHPLQTVFKYASAISPWVDASSTFSKTDINNAINPNLDANLPGALAINGGSGGHAILVDGYGYAYGSLYHHLNMGWGGKDNAWYKLPTVIASSYSYYRVTGMLFNVSPYRSGFYILSGRITDMAGRPLSGVKVVAKHVSGYYPNQSVYSNGRGIYAIAVSAGNYKITPSLSGFGFSPQFRTRQVGYSTARNSWFNNFTRVTRILRLSDYKAEFGIVALFSSKTIKITVFNDGTASLKVNGYSAPAGFSMVPSSFVVAPKGKQVVSFVFAPTVAGFVKGDLTLFSNRSSGVNVITVKGTGNVP